ncbi:MAG: hypothetical protein KA369_13300 [Spirochaetes bacterium]|nr:hypothetical protein [Spirochaetota bacterium]
MTPNCINCGGTVDPSRAQCPYCGTFYDRDNINPVSNIFTSRGVRKRAIYPIMIGSGVAICVAIYAFFFDRLSETQLVNLTPLWFFLITFGLYGYHAEKLLEIMASHRAADMRAARALWFSMEGRSPLVTLPAHFFFFAERFVNKPWPALIALVGSLAWGLGLLVFFNGIFPSL